MIAIDIPQIAYKTWCLSYVMYDEPYKEDNNAD